MTSKTVFESLSLPAGKYHKVFVIQVYHERFC